MQQCDGSGEGGGHRHKSPASLVQLSARGVRRVIVESVRRIRGRSASWVPRYFPCREPLSVCRHAVKTLHDYLLSTPHLFQVTFYMDSETLIHFLTHKESLLFTTNFHNNNN